MGFAGDNDEKFRMSANLDPHGRFEWGVPPASRGDYAFVQHMLYSLAENGRMGVILPHGVLFRGASEGRIRKQIIDMNLLEAVIGLPEALFFGTGIPACIMLFRKNRNRKDVLFIDASGEDNYEKDGNRNRLKEEAIEKIVETYNNYETIDKYSYVASLDEIKENDYNLNIPRYVDTFEEEDPVDMEEVARNIANIKKELKEVEEEMARYLDELGL
ncbi:MAG TPA: N-6 DNA methylase, partial [Tissierellaceae bacterium]|nr:N-6 DNA methylase [Tissierellaceae bacterium]